MLSIDASYAHVNRILTIVILLHLLVPTEVGGQVSCYYDFVGPPPVCRAVIGPNEINVLLDTGSSHSVLDIALLPSFDPNANTGLEEAVLNRPLVIKLAGEEIELRSPQFANLEVFRKAQDMSFMGIVGMDILRRFAIRFDFDKCTVHLSKQIDSQGDVNKIDMDLTRGTPFVRIKCGDEQSMQIDTGSMRGVVLGESRFKNQFKSDVFHSPASAITANGISRTRLFAEQIEVGFGDIPIRNILVQKSQDERSYIGMLFLCRFNFTLDFPNKLVTYTPSRRYFTGLDCADSWGVFTAKSSVPGSGNPGLAILSVRENSTAQSTGLRPGDLILGIDVDGRREYAFDELRNVMMLPLNCKVQVWVFRDGNKMAVDLVQVPRQLGKK